MQFQWDLCTFRGPGEGQPKNRTSTRRAHIYVCNIIIYKPEWKILLCIIRGLFLVPCGVLSSVNSWRTLPADRSDARLFSRFICTGRARTPNKRTMRTYCRTVCRSAKSGGKYKKNNTLPTPFDERCRYYRRIKKKTVNIRVHCKITLYRVVLANGFYRSPRGGGFWR